MSKGGMETSERSGSVGVVLGSCRAYLMAAKMGVLICVIFGLEVCIGVGVDQISEAYRAIGMSCSLIIMRRV